MIDLPELSHLLPVLAGVALGALVGWWLGRRGDAIPASIEPQPTDQRVEEEIDRAARDWARANGRGEMDAALVADKLSLVYRLSQKGRR